MLFSALFRIVEIKVAVELRFPFLEMVYYTWGCCYNTQTVGIVGAMLSDLAPPSLIGIRASIHNSPAISLVTSLLPYYMLCMPYENIGPHACWDNIL